MVVYPTPGTALYHATFDGWTPDTHKLTDLVDIGNWLVWAKTEDGQNNSNRPPLSWRQGDPLPERQPTMTVGDYMRLSGFFEEQEEAQ